MKIWLVINWANSLQLELLDFTQEIGNKYMQAKAVLKHFRQSPRKVRIELNSIRGKTLDKVLNHLLFPNQRLLRY